MASVPVIELSGVGPAIAARLNELGLFTSEDLLRSERRRLAELVEGASVAQIRRWQAVSALLEVNGMTVTLAEALHARGIEALDELASQSLSKLREHVEALRAAGKLAASPSDDELVAWGKDALLLRHTGTLNGTVTGARDAPLAGVTATCMERQARTDARGRFRLTRLPLGRALHVHLTHSDYGPKTVETRDVALPGALLGARFRLTKRRGAATPERTLSELDGDVLPKISGAPVRTRAQAEAPSERDVLRVIEKLDDGGVRAVSRLLDWSGGAFVARIYRLAKSAAPADARVGSHLLFRDGRWQAVELSPHQWQHMRRVILERKLRPALPPNPSAAEVARAARDFFAAREAARKKTTE